MAKKILVAEDEEALRKALSEVLKQNKYEVIGVMNGEAAMDKIKKEKPDLVLLDLILPKKDGFEVLEEMKADDSIKNIPVIILTNLESTRDIERALDAGATTYLVKANYDLEDVLKKIKSILEE
ncbi:MAG: response regulator [Candidatus Spechtbacterales bacterium]|nr:response regulator [Candidatus Spechtbacterales bacterium]